MPDYAELVEAARAAVIEACRVCRLLQQASGQIRTITKDDESPVTVADFASQAVVAHVLRERLDHRLHLVAEETAHYLRAEEHAAHLGAVIGAVQEVWPEADEPAVLETIELGAGDTDHAAFWTLDPVDGTKGFVRGGQYCVALAYVERGVPTIGVLGCPNLPRDDSEPLETIDKRGCVYVATKGDGAYEASADTAAARLARLIRTEHLPDEPVTVCESIESSHSDLSLTARIMAKLGAVTDLVRVDSQCKYAIVARGQADVYIRVPARRGYVERIWDHAAGSLIAAEAGCLVTDLDGRLLDFSHGRGLERNRGIVCARPRVHGRVMEAIERVRAAEG